MGEEKLIELLKEYAPDYPKNYPDDTIMDEIVISKRFWFIKWLVENNKIDFEKCWFNIKNYLSYNKRYDKGIVLAENYDNDTFVVREFYSPYEQLLMLLSISDTPIDDLLLYLK